MRGELEAPMTGALIGIVVAVLALAALVAGGLRRRTRASPGKVVDLGDETRIDSATGAVRSVQRADVLLAESELDELWTPVNLERLARTYWRFLTRVTLGLVRVLYTERERFVVLLAAPFKLFTFKAPEYEIDGPRALVRWQIERGLLVSRRGRGDGFLQIEVTRHPAESGREARIHVEVEVANFYPSIASRLSSSVYKATQARMHVLVTHAFLRSLARLDLAPSRVGALAGP
jgi:hypothetical protein